MGGAAPPAAPPRSAREPQPRSDQNEAQQDQGAADEQSLNCRITDHARILARIVPALDMKFSCAYDGETLMNRSTLFRSRMTSTVALTV